MQRYITQRLLSMVPVLLVLSALVFFSVRLIPGDAVDVQFAESNGGNAAAKEAARHQLGLDQPAWKAYPQWLGAVLEGDLGDSLITGRPVWDQIGQGLPLTLELAVIATLVAIAIAIPAGILSAVRRNSPTDYLVRLVAVAGQSIPSFFLATMVVLLPAIWFHWSAPLGYRTFVDSPGINLQQLVPGALVLGFALSAATMRMMRSSLLEVLRKDFIVTARSKGLSEQRLIVAHALRNAVVPVLATLGNQIGFLIGGSVIIESVFSLPGLGEVTLNAINSRDYTQIQGCVLVIAVGYLIVNLLVDLSYAFVDPRITYD